MTVACLRNAFVRGKHDRIKGRLHMRTGGWRRCFRLKRCMRDVQFSVMLMQRLNAAYVRPVAYGRGQASKVLCSSAAMV
jgi:hypothetical protein